MDLVRVLLRQSGKLVAVATLAGAAAGLAGTCLVIIIGMTIHRQGDPWRLGLIFVGTSVLWLALMVCSELCMLHATQAVIVRLRLDLGRQILRTPLTKLQKLDKHRLFAIVTSDVDSFIRAFQALPRCLCNVVLIAACLGYIGYLSWQLSLWLALTLLVCVWGYHSAERGPRTQMLHVRGKVDTLYGHFRDLIEGSKQLQLSPERGTVFVEQVMGETVREFRNSLLRAMTGYVWVYNIGTNILYFIIGLLLFAVPFWLNIRWEVLGTVTLVLLYVIGPISQIMLARPVFRQAGIALGRIRELETHPTVEELPSSAVGVFDVDGPLVLALEGVSHQHPAGKDDAPFILGPLDLRIRAGEILFIVGGNGSGKTTLALVILGLYQSESGRITLNGIPVEKNNLMAYRRHFSAVFSDSHLFAHLLFEDDAGLVAEAERYLVALDLSDKVSIVKGRFSTTELSAGQRKRLSLICCLLENRAIYLFDEWAADQDPLFKKRFYEELLPELKGRGKTVIVISHDDSYFKVADRVIKLADGQLQPYEGG